MRRSLSSHTPTPPFGGTFCGYKDGVGSEYYRTFLNSDSADDFAAEIGGKYDTRVDPYADEPDSGVRVYYTRKTAPALAS